MAAGEFAVAEKKLFKALDNRPDDSELWWMLMLCKCGLRNDGELVDAVKAKYESAADTPDAPPPQTPFDTSYCKNALKYATTPKRREFVERVMSELSEIWQSKRGKPLKTPKTKVKPSVKCDVSKIVLYAALAIAAVGGGLGAYALFAHVTWALWTGFILLILFSAAAFGARSRLVKKSHAPLIADILFIAMFAAVGTAITVAGAAVGSTSILILGIALLALAALLGVYRGLSGKSRPSGQPRENGKSGPARPSYDRANVKSSAKSETKNAKRSNNRNDYKDQDD